MTKWSSYGPFERCHAFHRSQEGEICWSWLQSQEWKTIFVLHHSKHNHATTLVTWCSSGILAWICAHFFSDDLSCKISSVQRVSVILEKRNSCKTARPYNIQAVRHYHLNPCTPLKNQKLAMEEQKWSPPEIQRINRTRVFSQITIVPPPPLLKTSNPYLSAGNERRLPNAII